MVYLEIPCHWLIRFEFEDIYIPSPIRNTCNWTFSFLPSYNRGFGSFLSFSLSLWNRRLPAKKTSVPPTLFGWRVCGGGGMSGLMLSSNFLAGPPCFTVWIWWEKSWIRVSDFFYRIIPVLLGPKRWRHVYAETYNLCIIVRLVTTPDKSLGGYLDGCLD